MGAMSDAVSSEDFAAILAQLRDWVRTRVVPREREIADADAIPDDLRKQAADMGLFGYAIPQEHGGLGLDLTQDVELAMELGYTSLAVRSMFGTNNGIAGQVLVNFGTDEQRAAWLSRLASGAVVASFALTEPGAGSNPAGLQTRAVRDGDDWVIDGQKRFITNAPSADLFVVFARTRPADSSGTGIAVFLVPADTPGVEVGAKDRKMGQEGAWTSDVLFSDVRVPASALVGDDVDAGYRAAMTSLARGRVHMAALAVGTAQRALDESVAYAASATQGGTVIGDFQLVQAMLADQQTGVLAGRALVRETAARYVSGEDRRIGPSAAKLFCTEMAGQVADLAVQIHGGSGYMRDVPVERIYRDVRLLRLYEGTSEIQRLIIGGGLVRAQQRRLPAARVAPPLRAYGRSRRARNSSTACRSSATATRVSGARATTRAASSRAARIMCANGPTSSPGRRPASLTACSMSRMAPTVRPSSMARHCSQPSTEGASTSMIRWMTGSPARSIQARAAVRTASAGSALALMISVSCTVMRSLSASRTAVNRASLPAK
jgi:acyl-CoA dehydrogenase